MAAKGIRNITLVLLLMNVPIMWREKSLMLAKMTKYI